MTKWNLAVLFESLHEDIQNRLHRARKSIGHPGAKGDASEEVWLELLQQYLPTRYHVAKAHVVDSEGNFSDEIDIVVFDRQYSPFIHKFQNSNVIPAESVYAVFEAKQSMNATLVKYAQNKVASVRGLKRTSLPIPHAGGRHPAKTPQHILGGMLTLESDWCPPFGDAFKRAVTLEDSGSLDLGCIAARGDFYRELGTGEYSIDTEKPATRFLFRLISELQNVATVPRIDVEAYAAWLKS
ncbi:MAG: DUF6602 domain-containing protein [Pseudomonadota bacterium]